MQVCRVADPGCLSGIPAPTFFSIPDPNFFHPGSRIHIKEFKYFNPKNCFLSSRKFDPGCSSRIRILTFYRSRIRIRNTACLLTPFQNMIRKSVFRRTCRIAWRHASSRGPGEAPSVSTLCKTTITVLFDDEHARATYCTQNQCYCCGSGFRMDPHHFGTITWMSIHIK